MSGENGEKRECSLVKHELIVGVGVRTSCMLSETLQQHEQEGASHWTSLL